MACAPGTALPAVLFPKKVCAAKFDAANENAGVVVGVAIETVNNGEKFPELTLVTVPDPVDAAVQPVAAPDASTPRG